MMASSFGGYIGENPKRQVPNPKQNFKSQNENLPASLATDLFGIWVLEIGIIERGSAAFDRCSDLVPPLSPGAVVVPDVVEAKQISEHKPGVARPFPDPAINHRIG